MSGNIIVDEIPRPSLVRAQSSNPLHTSERLEIEFPSVSTETIPILGTRRNLLILFSFSFFSTWLLTLNGMGSITVYTMKLKMPPLWAIAVGYICSIFAICAQITIGYFGDRIITRWGKRKPILCVLWPIISIVAVAFLNPPTTLKPLEVEAYYLICLVILTISGNMFQQVYAAWFYESCASQEDYRVVIVYGITAGSGFGSLIGLIGVVMGMVSAMAIIAAIGASATIAVLLWYFPVRTLANASKQPPLLSSVRVLSSSPEYITVVLNEIVIGTAMTLGGEFLTTIVFTNFPAFMRHYKQFFVYYIIFAILQSISSVFVSIGMSVLLSHGWEKVKIYLGFNKLFLALSVIFATLYIPGLASTLDSRTEAFIFFVWLSFVILMILAFSAAQFLRGLIVRDLIRFDTFRTGLNRENMYQTALNVPASIASQFLASIPLCMLTSTGLRSLPPNYNDDLFTSKYSWNYGTHVQVSVYSTFLMFIGMALAYYWFRRYPLLQGIMTKIEQAINNREEKRQRLESARADIKFGSVGPEKPAEDDAAETVEEADSDAGRLSNAIDSGVGSIADDTDEMLMNHFSFTELRAMCISDFDDNKKSKALNRIAFYSRINLFLVCPATVAALLAGLKVQIVNEYTFTVVVVNLFLVAFLFGLYEMLRVQPIAQLGGLSGMDVTLKAKAACRKLTQRQDSLKELLARSGIDADDPSGCRQSLAPPPEDTVAADFIDSGPFSSVFRSYAWVYAAQGALLVVGLLFALVIDM